MSKDKGTAVKTVVPFCFFFLPFNKIIITL